jgi:hypothetical protein
MTNFKTPFGILAFILCAMLCYVMYQYIDARLVIEFTQVTKVFGVTIWSSISDEDITLASMIAAGVSTFVSATLFVFARRIRDRIIYKYRGYRIQKTWGNV